MTANQRQAILAIDVSAGSVAGWASILNKSIANQLAPNE
jgi:hypothetical protein